MSVAARARDLHALPRAEVEVLRACPLCGAGDHRPLATPGRWIGGEVFAGLEGAIGLVRCRGCRLVFTNPRPVRETLNEFYSGDTYECHEAGGGAGAKVKAAFVLGRVEAVLPAGAPRMLLDYGAGGGSFLLDARELGWSVRGFEPGRRGLATCRAAGLDVTGDLRMLPDGAFGVVTMHHVLEHIADPAAALGGIRRLMAPGGRLLVEVPNARSLRARLSGFFANADERYRAFPIHLMYYEAPTLRRMLERAGWEVESQFTMGLGLDELFVRGAPSGPAFVRTEVKPRGRRGWRRMVRDAFLGLGLGENLAMLARVREGVA